jgi:voltage-gated potassium channel
MDYFERRRRDRMLKNITGHYIVCGAGRVGRAVIHELLRSHATVVLIDNDINRAKWATDKGVITMVGDATKDETLSQARVSTAKGLVAAISSDAENVYVTLSAKVLNPQLVIAARASDDQAEEKLRRAGATTVFTPYSFIGHRLAQSMLRPHVASFLDVASAFRQSDLDLEIEQLQIGASSFLVSKTLEELRLGNKYGVIVLAIQRPSGQMQFNPADLRIQAGDVLITMGERAKLKRLEQEIGRH